MIICVHMFEIVFDSPQTLREPPLSLSDMPEFQPACIICIHIIKSKGKGHTITSQHETQLQPFASRKVYVNVDRAHRDCWKNPSKYTKIEVTYQLEIRYHTPLGL